MASTQSKLTLMPNRWFGWQMLPGYHATSYDPYHSPIWIQDATPRKTGRGILAVRFINALYAEGVQDFTLDLKVLKRELDYLVAEIIYPSHSVRDRTAIISRIEFDWIRRLCPELWAQSPPSHFGIVEQRDDVSLYLNALFQVAG